MAKTGDKTTGADAAETNADKPAKKSIEQQIIEIDELYVHNKISASEYMQLKAKLTQSKQ